MKWSKSRVAGGLQWVHLIIAIWEGPNWLPPPGAVYNFIYLIQHLSLTDVTKHRNNQQSKRVFCRNTKRRLLFQVYRKDLEGAFYGLWWSAAVAVFTCLAGGWVAKNCGKNRRCLPPSAPAPTTRRATPAEPHVRSLNKQCDYLNVLITSNTPPR